MPAMILRRCEKLKPSTHLINRVNAVRRARLFRVAQKKMLGIEEATKTIEKQT